MRMQLFLQEYELAQEKGYTAAAGGADSLQAKHHFECLPRSRGCNNMSEARLQQAGVRGAYNRYCT